MQIYKLENRIKDYDWGSPDAIPELLGRANPYGKPQAELWMGAHPQAPSLLIKNGRRIPLDEEISADPEAILGKSTSERFGQNLPFLFKVLAADKSLSIQAHPDKKQAEEGFIREEKEGIPPDAFNRNYKDKNHKPEIISALTPFWAMNGFRRKGEIAELFSELNLGSIQKEVEAFKNNLTSQGLRDLFRTLLTLDKERKEDTVKEAISKAKGLSGDHFEWILQLNREHPGDVGILSPLLLNLICLNPGEALFQRAGVLHAYLKGVGIELMANSDNVLRGALTNKHVDVEELLNILDFSDHPTEIIKPVRAEDGEEVYHSPAEEFRLSRISLKGGKIFRRRKQGTPEIIISTEGRGSIKCPLSGEELPLNRGESVFIYASACNYEICGEITVYRAVVPHF